MKETRDIINITNREKIFSTIIDSSADAIFYCDADDRIMSWNKGARDILGYEPDEIIGKSIITLIPKELIELGELYYIQRELETNGFIRKYETQRLHKNGKLIYVDMSITLLRDENNEIIGTAHVIKDITSRKELEFELRRTILELSKSNELSEILYTTFQPEEIYRILLVAITAGEGLRFNRAFLLLVNERSKVLEGYLAIGPSTEREATAIWNKLQDQYRSLKEILQIYKIEPRGADRSVNEIVRRIRVPLDREDHLLIRPLITKRVYQVMHGVIHSSKQYRTDVNGMNLFDLLGNDTFVIVPLFTKKELLGVVIADNKITRKEIGAEDIEGLKLFANQASLAIENARLHQSLEERIKELQLAYKQLEEKQEQLVRTERLAAIGEMSAKVAHEIRNPLVSIGGFARLLEKKLPEESELKKYAQIIREEVIHLEYILNNLLSTASPPKPHIKPLDIHQIIHQVLITLGTALEKRDIKIRLNFANPATRVLGDEKMLHQIFFNLIKNAMEAVEGKEGDKEISVYTKDENDYVLIRVRDNGAGIPAGIRDKIFQPFFTTKSTGTGLGLAIVKQILEQHKGRLKIQSSPGKGTTFMIEIPRHKDSGDS